MPALLPRLFALLAALTLALPATVPARPPPKHLAGALVLLKQVRPENTSYRHRPTSVKWAGEGRPAECHADCSGLVNALLAHAYPGLDADFFEKWLGRRRPRAEDYYEAIRTERGFRRARTVGAIRPGDLLAVKYPPGAGNTGHVLLVAGPPRPRAASAPLVTGTTQWEVAVLDESTSGHGKDDTRARPDGTSRQGLGRGTLRLYAEAGTGRLTGYSWSTATRSKFYGENSRPIVAGTLALPGR